MIGPGWGVASLIWGWYFVKRTFRYLVSSCSAVPSASNGCTEHEEQRILQRTLRPEGLNRDIECNSNTPWQLLLLWNRSRVISGAVKMCQFIQSAFNAFGGSATACGTCRGHSYAFRCHVSSPYTSVDRSSEFKQDGRIFPCSRPLATGAKMVVRCEPHSRPAPMERSAQMWASGQAACV